MKRIVALSGLAATLLLGACASPSGPSSAPAAPTPPATPASPAPVAPVSAAPSSQSPLLGTWEGKWTVDSMGYEGRAILEITGLEGNRVVGRATMYDTPYGDLTEAFEQASFDGQKLDVKHKTNAAYTLTLGDKDGKPRLNGPLTYNTDTGSYTGRLRVDKK
ncbi:hypothetical protein [Chitinimonas lacunae]|uniref:Lipoprotein n=1 Tax=Chitinimonas lacunae TaxID=1963018 RepID=A0ABV8MV26_9NEIS